MPTYTADRPTVKTRYEMRTSNPNSPNVHASALMGSKTFVFLGFRDTHYAHLHTQKKTKVDEEKARRITVVRHHRLHNHRMCHVLMRHHYKFSLKPMKVICARVETLRTVSTQNVEQRTSLYK